MTKKEEPSWCGSTHSLQTYGVGFDEALCVAKNVGKFYHTNK